MKNKLDITTLKDYPIFNNLKENEINIFSKKITIKKFSKNEIILKEGEEGNSVLFLLEGDISITQALTLKTNKFDNREKELIRINSNTQKFTFIGQTIFSRKTHRNIFILVFLLSPNYQ